MNERLRELAKQAGFQYDSVKDIWYIEGFNPSCDQEFQKFAKLLIRECVRYFNEDYQRDFDILWREDLSKGMKEHFGVEE